MSVRARVFISCGQDSEEEVRIAKTIKERLVNELSFDAYVARMDHSVNSLTQNIFEKLEHSEYFIFIDFKREKIVSNAGRRARNTDSVYRGSLFTNQELSIAAFIKDIKILGFQEQGVKELDGMLRYLHINCENFTDRVTLPDLVMDKIHDEGWVSGWRNELKIEYITSGTPARVIIGQQTAPVQVVIGQQTVSTQVVIGQRTDIHDFYHLRVININNKKLALNCSAYIEKIETVGIPPYTPNLAELKWKSQLQDNLSIPPGESRLLDAYRIPSNREWVMLGINTHLIDYQGLPEEYQLRDGDHTITYVIYSENFSPARIRLRIVKNNRTITVSPISE